MSQSLDNFLMIPSLVCRPRTNGQSIFRPGSLSLVSDVMVCFGLFNFVTLQFTTAMYGRYSRASWGVLMPARLAWFSQEVPSFVVPLLISLGLYDSIKTLFMYV